MNKEFIFREATPKDELELKDTVELMLSEDCKDRFEAEYMQLEIRIEKLGAMLDKLRAGTLNFKPSSPIELLECQLLSMKMYLGLLKDRKAFESAENTKESTKEPTKQKSETLINREDASSLLWQLVNSNILADDICDKLAEIANIIDDESIGFHFWGADADERAKLFTAVRSDLITDEYCEAYADIASKYSFAPSDFEKHEAQKNTEAAVTSGMSIKPKKI